MSTIKGKLIVKNNTEAFGKNDFRKRTFVIETDEVEGFDLEKKSAIVL